jgi:hypothetical protein
MTRVGSSNATRPLCRRRAPEHRSRATRLRTNLCGREPAELWRFNIQLPEVEAAFKNFKDDLQLRPIHHQLIERVEAHILVAFLAYLGGLERAGGAFSPMEVAPCQIDHGLRPAPRKRKAMTVTPCLSCFLKAFEMALRASLLCRFLALLAGHFAVGLQATKDRRLRLRWPFSRPISSKRAGRLPEWPARLGSPEAEEEVVDMKIARTLC